MRVPATASSQPTDANVDPYRLWKRAGLWLLALAWIGLGLAGHDPWKTEDATTFGVAWEMNQRDDYVLPRLAGEVYLPRPPLVPVLAAVSQTLFAPPLEPYNAARIAAGLLLGVTLLFTALAMRELSGQAQRWLPVLMLIGSIGMWDRGHVLSGQLGMCAALAVALSGHALALRRPIVGGIALGVGVAIGFLANGFAVPVWVALASAILVALGPAWRTTGYALTMLVGVVVTLTLSLPWVIALYARDPTLVATWLATETPGQYLGFIGQTGDINPLYHARNLLWFAWPALPLIAWTLWTRARGFSGGLAQPAVQIPGVLAIVIYANLLVMPDPRLIDALPLLVPFALLAALEVDSLRRGFSAALDWFGILTFGLLAIVVWGIWIDARLHGMSPTVAALFRDTEIGFQPTFHLGSVIVAIFLTLLWVTLVRPARRSNRRALLNWAVGVTLAWGLYSTIWLPYLDSRRSYRQVMEDLNGHLPTEGCVTSRGLGEPQRALLFYFTGIATVREETHDQADCRALLVQYGSVEGRPPAIPGWRATWQGGRRGDATERYVLYVRQNDG